MIFREDLILYNCLQNGINNNVDNIRRYRTAFTREQIGRLEKEFVKENYISRPKRCELAAELNLPENTIKVRKVEKMRDQSKQFWPGFGCSCNQKRGIS